MLSKCLFFLMILVASVTIPKSDLHAAVPQPPYTSQVVSTYIWQVLLPELQSNMNEYSTIQTYQQAVIQLQGLYQQATVTTSSDQLGVILAQATALANPTLIPQDVQQAEQIMASAQSIQSQIGQIISSFQNNIATLSQTMASLATQVTNFQMIIDAMPAPSQKALADLKQAETDLSTAQLQLSQLLSQNSVLSSANTNFSQEVQNITSLAQQIIGGNDPNGANLAELQTLFATLTQNQVNFQQGQQAVLTGQLSTLNNLISTSLSADISALQTDTNTVPPSPKNGIGCYIDMGSLSAQLWNFMEYYPVQQLNITQLDQYLNSLFSQLTQAGVNQINLSFAQLGSIDSLVSGGINAPSDDVIAQMMVSFPGALQEVIKLAHASGIKIDLSFGGENGASMTIVGTGETAQGQAQKLVQFMQALQIDAVDFDFESTLFTTANSPQDAVAFFTTLHQELQAMGKTLALTIEGSIFDWPQNYLKELFYDQSGELVFFSLFDELNLMLYSETQYYIDANNATWGIEQWLNLLGKAKSATAIHIGFEDGVNYASPNASAGESYVLDTTNPGTAAAEIYQQLQQKLMQDGYATNLGEPFFWPDINHHAAGTWSRYESINSGGMISVNFDTDVMLAFYNKLQ